MIYFCDSIVFCLSVVIIFPMLSIRKDRNASPRLLREFNLSAKYRQSWHTTCISRSGIVVTSTLSSHRMLVIDTTTKTKTKSIEFDELAELSRITGDGKKILCCEDVRETKVEVWSVDMLATGEMNSLYAIRCETENVIQWVSHDDKKVFLRTYDFELSAYNLDDGTLIVSNADKADQLIIISMPKGEKLYATFHGEDQKNYVKIFDLGTGKNTCTLRIEFSVREIRDTPRGDEFLMLMTDYCGYKLEGECHLALLKIESKESISVRFLIPDLSIDVYCKYPHAYAENSDGLILAYATGHGTIVIVNSEGYSVIIDGFPSGNIKLEFTHDARKLIVRDQNAVHVYDSCIHPFWSHELHSIFRGEQKKSIKTLFCANRILSTRKKRKRLLIAEIPKEIMLHILSFIRRDY